MKVVHRRHPVDSQQTIPHLAVLQPSRSTWGGSAANGEEQRWGVDPVSGDSPSMRTRRMSLMMVKVVNKTNTEKRKVQMGSAILYSG